jgi:hypothetical protein
MAVGPRFNDPATQAAMAAQSGQTTPETDSAETTPAETQPATETVAAADLSMNVDPAPNSKETDPGADAGASKADADNADAADPDQSEGATTKKLEDVTPEGLDKALTDAGYDTKKLGEEMANNDGIIPENLVKELKEKFDPAQVDEQVNAVQDQYKAKLTAAKQVEAMNTYIYETLANGDADKGKENLQVLSTWAKDNLPAEKLSDINKRLLSGDKKVVHAALAEAVGAWKKGQEKPMMSGDAMAAANAPTQPEFKPLSRDEFVQICMTKKYNEDLAYQKEIDDRRRKTIDQTGAGIGTPEYSGARPPIY